MFIHNKCINKFFLLKIIFDEFIFLLLNKINFFFFKEENYNYLVFKLFHRTL